jgi:hypothetical protein
MLLFYCFSQTEEKKINMMALQLEFFKTEEECEMDALRHALEQVRKSSDKVRKGTYAKINELTKEAVDLKNRLEILERGISKGAINVR